MEAEACEEIDTVRASISSNEVLVEVSSSCISDAEVCKNNSTHAVSNLVVGSSDSISYHSAISETKNLQRKGYRGIV